MKQLKRMLCLLLVCMIAVCLLSMTAAAETEYDIAGVEMVGSGWRYDNDAGAYEPVWKSRAALAADGSAKDSKTYSISTGSFYKTYSGGTLSNKLTEEPAYGVTYYSTLAINCPNSDDAKLDKDLFKVSIPGFIVEYKTDYFGDGGFTWRIIFSATRYEDVYVGGVLLQAGQCLPSGASEPQVDKPEACYAYNAGKYLELNCYSYEGDGLTYKAGIYAEHDLAIKVIGNCSLYMAEGCDGIHTTQNLLYVTGSTLTIYADYSGIYAEKNITLNNADLIIESNRAECVYAGNDLTVGNYAILNLNCKDAKNYGLGALMAFDGDLTIGDRDVLVADKAYGPLKTPHSAVDVASYPRIVIREFTDQVIVGNVKLTDGQYLAVGGTAATTAKPSGGYAYFKDGILTLHNYTLKNSPYKTSSYTTYDEYIQIFAPNTYVLSLSGNNKLESDEKVTSAVRAPNDLFIQQAASGGSLEIDSCEVGVYTYNAEVFFDNANLDITSTETGISCGNGSLLFNNSDLTIHSRNAYGIFQQDNSGHPLASQSGVTMTGSKVEIFSKYEGITAFSNSMDFRMTGGECTVVTDRGSAIEAGNNIRILGGKLYLKVVSDYSDDSRAALNARYGQTVIASGLPVMASTESYGQLGAYDPAKVKEYDWMIIGSPTQPQLTSYTVTFNPNGGPGETVTVTGINEGGYVTMPAAPAADWDGRAFLGWKPADATGNTVFEPGKNRTITKDTEFLAQWESVALAEAHALVDAPTQGKTPDMTPTVPDGANYTAEVDYWYYSDGKGNYPHLTATDVFEPGMLLSLRLVFKPNAGYTFDKNTVFTINGEETIPYGMPGNQEIKFYVKGNGYTITFDPNGGSVTPTSMQTDYDGCLTGLPIPTHSDTNMLFDGWHTDKYSYSRVADECYFSEDTTLYAHWKLKPANIITEVNIQSIVAPVPGEMPINAAVVTTLGVNVDSDSFWVRYDPATGDLTDQYDDGSYVDSVPFREGEIYILQLFLIAQPNFGFDPHVKVIYQGVELPWPDPTDITKSFASYQDTDWMIAMINPDKVIPAGPKVTRLAGKDRLVTSQLIADQLKLQMGVEKFENIIVASGGTFADALPGSYLSAVKNAPILLTLAKDKYVNQTADYIKANLKDGGTVYILGGESAVPASMEKALNGLNVQRVAGKDRFGTNLEILKEAGVKPGDEILVCTAKEFADSLSAAATGKPILLVYKKITDEQKTYLKTLSGNTFCVVGGTTAVPDSIAKEMESYGAVSRLAGKDRLDTSILVAKKYFPDARTSVVAYGWDFPDGLCGGSLAYATKSPLILAHSKEKLFKFTADYTVNAGLKAGVVLGGDKLVTDQATRAIFGMAADGTITVLK